MRLQEHMLDHVLYLGYQVCSLGKGWVLCSSQNKMASLFPPVETLWISDATAPFTTGNKVTGPHDNGCSKLRTRPVTSHASYRLQCFGVKKDP